MEPQVLDYGLTDSIPALHPQSDDTAFMPLSEILQMVDAESRGYKAAYTAESGQIIPINLYDGKYIKATDANIKTLSSVQAAIMSKAYPISTMEFKVYQKVDGVKYERPEHPLNYINRKPNPFATRNKWMMTAVYHHEYYRDHYARILRNGMVLDMLKPEDVTPIPIRDPETGVPDCFYKISGIERLLPHHEIIHVAGLGENLWSGEKLSYIGQDDFSLELALREYGIAFFTNGAKPANVIIWDPKILGEKIPVNMINKMKKDFKKHIGSDSGGTKILSPGMDIKNINFPNEANQFVESKTHSIQSTARQLNTSLHKLKELSRGTYNNLEIVEQSSFKDSIQPVTEAFETEYTEKLFSETEIRAGYFFEFDTSKLLKFDPKTRAEFYKLVTLGMFTNDEFRAMEGKNPLPDGLGSKPMVQSGMIFLEDLKTFWKSKEGKQALKEATLKALES